MAAIVVSPKGDIRPCILADADWSDGNIVENSFRAAIEADFGSRYFVCSVPNIDICKECSYFGFCRGCFVRPFRVSNVVPDLLTNGVCHWLLEGDNIVKKWLCSR